MLNHRLPRKLLCDRGCQFTASPAQRFIAQCLGNVREAAGSFEQLRFVKESNRPIAILRFAKNFGKSVGAMVRIDEKFCDADVDQMIKREGDERFLKDRDERLGEIISERTESRSKSGA